MTKKEFKSLMADFLKAKKADERLSAAINEMAPDCHTPIFSLWEETARKAIEAAMNDVDSQWISYWLYDLNQGREWKITKVRDRDDNDIRLKTLDDLYNAIIKHGI